MKKKIIIVVILISLAVIGVISYQIFSRMMNNKISMYTDTNDIQYLAKVDSEYFYVYRNNQWQKEFIKGVNIGAGMPGNFPGEFGTTKDDYLRWFKYISDMNANTIRVYTILKPDFYNALLEYNQSAKTPLLLIQGVWINEEDIATYMDAYNPEIKDKFKSEIEATIDVLHGNKIVQKQTGHAYGVYEADVSQYVIGYIMGIEWDPGFVMTTNNNNSEKTNYDGQYLYSVNASPFENFLCESGNDCIAYETDHYKMQKTVSFVNWPTTDMLSHPNEPLENEDSVSVNMEHIKKKDTFKPGLFASYHIYPYYPNFMNYQKQYINNKDENGNVDTYGGYLADLKKQHTMPILVAEFGIPAGRGKAHDNIYMGFNQGNVTETQQGEMEASMLKDIYNEGYAGGLVFAFQDEWFKRTWNTMDLDLPQRRAYWNNQQTNEQHFGLLAFDSGEKECPCYVDGNAKEWEGSTPISTNNENELFVKSDDAYVYFMVKTSNYNFDQDTLIIPVDTIQNQGNTSNNDVSFDKAADFLISINGKDNSRIMVDAYYDSFQYLYGENSNIIPKKSEFSINNSGAFDPMNLYLSKDLYLPEDKITVPLSQYETGKLAYGDGNPNNSDFNSLTDFCMKDNILEIRIPWQLLNFMDPSSKIVMNDLHINGIQPLQIDGINAGVGILNNMTDANIAMNFYGWEDWDIPVYHERLKPSYYILKDAFNLYQ
ncbi:family 2 glycosyl transferase [Acetobacterium paludosum]|uniref:Family 2 glycosyl transferase n=1 Tax=Acetobacterium paludosum TaxID=52693 RepID=A0A923HVM9_9FIRM|nr:family 2 glycosyl transferase [Acetobacterium paludosum]MBC3889373.1 family 2 glycosyl transferase [Acetobacterium paludosum]